MRAEGAAHIVELLNALLVPCSLGIANLTSINLEENELDDPTKETLRQAAERIGVVMLLDGAPAVAEPLRQDQSSPYARYMHTGGGGGGGDGAEG